MGAHSLTLTRYTTDDGITGVFRQQEQLRVAAGNTAADGTEGSLPRHIKLRRIHATRFDAGGAGQAVGKFTRSLVIGDLTNPLWAHGAGHTTVTLPQYDSVPGVGQTTPNVEEPFDVTGRTGEEVTFR